MKVAVIGSGISGLASAYIAKHNGHDVSLFEKDNYYGGHSNTIEIDDGKTRFPVDTGFLVHNELTYPYLIQLFKHLSIETVETEMSLSIRIKKIDLEWGGNNLSTVFAQKKNLLNPQFYRMLKDILHFNKNSKNYLEEYKSQPKKTLGELLKTQGYSDNFANWYIIPMAAAIWSTPAEKILDFPAFTFLQFCLNHHLLQINDRPVWRTIVGGSREYVKKITDQIDKKYLNQNIQKITRTNNKVQIYFNNRTEEFDSIILASHADQALQLIGDLLNSEKEILSSFSFQKNTAVVHSDHSVLPVRKKLWSAWNYLSTDDSGSVSVNYLINQLQRLSTDLSIIVSLNPQTTIDPNKIFKTIEYEHPLFDQKAIEAQKMIPSLQGTKSTYYVGAWQGYGFHEDGLKSAVELAKILNWKLPWV